VFANKKYAVSRSSASGCTVFTAGAMMISTTFYFVQPKFTAECSADLQHRRKIDGVVFISVLAVQGEAIGLASEMN